MGWYQIWHQKMSTAILSEVISILSLKNRKFKGRYIWGKRRENMALVKIMSRAKRPMRNQFSKFGNNSRCILAYLFLPSLSSESPTSASAEGASCADGTDGREIKSILRFSSNTSMLTSGMFLFQIWCQNLSTVFFIRSYEQFKFQNSEI